MVKVKANRDCTVAKKEGDMKLLYKFVSGEETEVNDEHVDVLINTGLIELVGDIEIVEPVAKEEKKVDKENSKDLEELVEDEVAEEGESE